MLSITCINIAKRFNKEVLFKDFNFTFQGHKKYAILGPNSSGKSTLLKIIGGVLAPTKGNIEYSPEGTSDSLFSFCSPEMHLLDDFTVRELFELHFKFKASRISIEKQWEEAELQRFLHKKFGTLSSGLKNKIKLALALFTDTPVLLLDEPCTNFDDKNSNWYLKMIDKYWTDAMVIVASNQEIEYQFCEERVTLNSYKKEHINTT
jgi:ABC-2 type transport system ATP-binding protein